MIPTMNVNCWIRIRVGDVECIMSVQGKQIKSRHNNCSYFKNGSIKKAHEIRSVFMLDIGCKKNGL
jgi:hypothetical protein